MFSGIDPDFRRATMFVGNSTTTNVLPVMYQVPYGARLLYVFGAGAGAGGGGGASGPAGTTRGGGGGTSSTSTVEALIPTSLIPNTLSIEVGKGGLGGAAGTAGSIGGLTRILIPQRTGRILTFVPILNLGRASAGQPGTSTSGGFGANFDGMLSNYPVFAIQNSLGGASNGGAHTGGASGQSGGANNLNAMSTGGGGVGTNDVSFAAGNSVTIRGTISGGTAANGFDGNRGFSSDPLDFGRPFVRNGATGGASNGTGTGGRGGDGGLACSGGGGGGGGTGGRGGDGGDGFIILIPIF